MYRIISISGGGVRGLIPARELSQLSLKEQRKVDCFAGTSTGGILALGAAAGFSFEEMENLYRYWIPTIFKPRSWFDKFWKLDELRRANYDNAGLIQACKDVFKNLTLADLKHDVVIPTVKLDGIDPDSGVRTAQTVWYTADMPGAENTFLWEIAVQTASAPVYFPSYNGFIDGGTSMNNPAAKAVQVAINRGFMLEDISLLAITTGSGPLYKASKRNDWGLTQWGPNIISLIMRLTEQTSLDLLQLNRLGFYAVADYKLNSEIPLDDVKWAKSFGASSYQKNDKASKAIKEFKATLHDS